MDFYLKNDNFNTKNIKIKRCKKCNKLLYDLDFIKIIGIIFKINDYEILNENKQFISIKVMDENVLKNMKKLDDYFKGMYGNYHTFINDKNIIELKSFQRNNKGILLININNIKLINQKMMVQIFTL
tara:strand:- start:714 stop:1094 length:381 start_codon:yes stop_codon:yes gene_type:complete